MKHLLRHTDFLCELVTSLMIRGIQMGEMPKLGWLIELVERAVWANSLYFLYLLSLSISKILSLLESGVYEPLPKDPTAKVESRAQILSKHEATLPTNLKHKFAPYHSKPPLLNGLPKIRKPDIPLKPAVSSIGSPCDEKETQYLGV
jgi:hypothetical protein